MQDEDSLKLLMFDFDGTLVNLSINWEKLKEDLRRLLGSKKPLVPLLSSIEAIAKGNVELKEKAWKLIEEYELEAVGKINFDPEMVKLFSKLKAESYRIALLTLQGRKPIEKALRKLKLRKFFDCIISREETPSREEQIEKALKFLGIKPGHAMVIADRLHDVSVASKLGCKTVAITNKNHIKADHKFTNVKQIMKILFKSS